MSNMFRLNSDNHHVVIKNILKLLGKNSPYCNGDIVGKNLTETELLDIS